MARLSFRYLGQFQYYIIKCDKDGAVLIFPHPEKEHHHAILLVPPAPAENRFEYQVGSGDIMTAVFAAEFHFEEDSRRAFEAALEAFLKANAAVACYWEMDWHRMPPLAAITERQKNVLETRPEIKTTVFNGMRFLPMESTVHMSEFQTDLPGVYSQDKRFRDTIIHLTEDVFDPQCWERGMAFKHLVLGAPSGTGKSRTKDLIIQRCPAHGIHAMELPSLRDIKLDPSSHEAYYKKQLQALPPNCQKLLIIVDEARKGTDLTKLSKWAPNPLDNAGKRGIRFLLISAEFTLDEESNPAGTELFRRCHPYFYSGLRQRPADIPYYFAALIFESLPTIQRIEIPADGLLWVIESTLKNPNPDRLRGQALRGATRASRRQQPNAPLLLTYDDIDDTAKSPTHDASALDNYLFYR